MVLGVNGLVGDFNVPDIAAEVFFDVIHAGLNIGRGPLQEGLDGAVGQIADIAGQVIAAGHSLGGIPKADPLHTALEYDMFCCLSHNLKPTDYTDYHD